MNSLKSSGFHPHSQLGARWASSAAELDLINFIPVDPMTHTHATSQQIAFNSLLALGQVCKPEFSLYIFHSKLITLIV